VSTVESTDVRTYEIETSSSAFRIEVPANARVTYGPIIGAGGGKGSGYGNGNAFRVWLGSKDTGVQLALFNNVVSFRDLSLSIKRRAVRKYGTEEWMVDDGSWTGKKSEQVEKRWVPMDELDEPTAEPTEEPF
jgi:hypothetical protein